MMIRKLILQERAQSTRSFTVGNHVQPTKKKQTFEKGHETNHTDEIFKIVKVMPKLFFLIYKFCDLASKPIKESFHEQELSKFFMSDKPPHRLGYQGNAHSKRNDTITYTLEGIPFSLRLLEKQKRSKMGFCITLPCNSLKSKRPDNSLNHYIPTWRKQ